MKFHFSINMLSLGQTFRTATQQKTTCRNIDENRIEQCFAAHCSQLSTILFSIVKPDSRPTIYCSILLTTMKNVASKTLLNPVELQTPNFLLCKDSLNKCSSLTIKLCDLQKIFLLE